LVLPSPFATNYLVLQVELMCASWLNLSLNLLCGNLVAG
jgi:hypothetical protein